jgi:hypothetical protein
LVSSKNDLTNAGAGKSYSLMCYVSAADSVVVVLTIGGATINKGGGGNKIQATEQFNIGVIGS